MGEARVKTICVLLILFTAGQAWSRLDMAPRTGGAARIAPGHELSGLDQIAEARQDQLCGDMKPGESRTVNEEPRNSPTGITRRYRVTRDTGNPKVYNVDLNIRFWGNQNYVHEQYGKIGSVFGYFPRHNETHQRFSQRAQECFRQMRGRLKDPDGNELHLNLTNDESVPSNTVWVEGRGFRSNSSQWESQIDCPTIVHEALHLMGLCDGYHERTTQAHGGLRVNDPTASQYRYDCRNTEPDTSVMTNPWNALEDQDDILFCNCTNDGCRTTPSRHEILTSTGPLTCPPGYSTLYSGTAGQTNSRHWAQNVIKEPGRIMLTRRSTAPRESSLLRAHTQTILKPQCYRGYYHRCSGNAYRTRTEDSCLVQPPECGGLN